MSLGMILYYYGVLINATNASPFSSGTLNHPVNIMFAGSLLASLCWVSDLCIIISVIDFELSHTLQTVQMMLWPFYEVDEADLLVERSRLVNSKK